MAAPARDPGGTELPPLLAALLAAPGPPGYEERPAHAWRAAAREFADDVAGDVLGSSTARVRGGGERPRLAIVGHIDEIGLIVTHITDRGLLRIAALGGWDPQVLVGQRVTVLARDGEVPGVIGGKPRHLQRGDERKRVPELRDLHIDIGASDREEAAARVRVGDVAVIAADPQPLVGGRVASRALDNRLGAYVALEALRRVAEAGGADVEVVAIASTQEEITFAGARTTAYAVEPDVAVIVDVTHATDVPGADEGELGSHPLGSGAVIARGATIAPAVFEGLVAAAENHGIPYTVEATARSTGTDADAVHLTRSGVACGVVSIPLRYMHQPVEIVDLADVEACAALVAAYALALRRGQRFER